MPPKLSPTQAARQIKTRTEMRAYILSELPGWGEWLTGAAGTIQQLGRDEQLLRSSDDLLRDVTAFAQEWVEKIGIAESEEYFLPYAQEHSRLDPDQDYPAGVPTVALHLKGLFDRRQAWPSPTFLGLLGALGLAGHRGSGRRPDLRRARAIEFVTEDLLPYVASRAGREPQVHGPVLPNMYEDTSFDAANARLNPVPIALAALVARFLALPGRKDSDLEDRRGRNSRRDPELIDFGGQVLRHTIRELEDQLGKAKNPEERLDGSGQE